MTDSKSDILEVVFLSKITGIVKFKNMKICFYNLPCNPWQIANKRHSLLKTLVQTLLPVVIEKVLRNPGNNKRGN